MSPVISVWQAVETLFQNLGTDGRSKGIIIGLIVQVRITKIFCPNLPCWLEDHLVYYSILQPENRKTYIQNILSNLGLPSFRELGRIILPKTPIYARQALKSWQHPAHPDFWMKTVQPSQAHVSSGFCVCDCERRRRKDRQWNWQHWNVCVAP